MTAQDSRHNAHPLKEHLERNGLWWAVCAIISVKMTEERLKLSVYGIEPMTQEIKAELDWVYETFYGQTWFGTGPENHGESVSATGGQRDIFSKSRGHQTLLEVDSNDEKGDY